MTPHTPEEWAREARHRPHVDDVEVFRLAMAQAWTEGCKAGEFNGELRSGMILEGERKTNPYSVPQ